MINMRQPKLDEKQKKMKGRLNTLYALLVIIILVIIAVVFSMKPMETLTTKRAAFNVKTMYFDGKIDLEDTDLAPDKQRRAESLNDHPICISAIKTAEMTEESAKNFLLSWLYVKYPELNITDDSIVYKDTKWRSSYEACNDTYLSNVFQYDKRQAQSDIMMDNVVENWMRSGLIIFLGSLNIIMVLWFVSIYRNELEHYNKR